MDEDDVVDPQNLTGYRNSHSKVSVRLGVFSLFGIVILITFLYTMNIYGLHGRWMYNESISTLLKVTLTSGIVVNLLISLFSTIEHRILGAVCGSISTAILFAALFM